MVNTYQIVLNLKPFCLLIACGRKFTLVALSGT